MAGEIDIPTRQYLNLPAFGGCSFHTLIPSSVWELSVLYQLYSKGEKCWSQYLLQARARVVVVTCCLAFHPTSVPLAFREAKMCMAFTLISHSSTILQRERKMAAWTGARLKPLEKDVSLG